MIAFNFVRRERAPVVRALLALQIPKPLRTPLAASLAAIAVIGGAYVIEADRLQSALAIQRSYRARYENSEAMLAQTKIRFVQLQRLAQLDRRIHDMETSGLDDARRLAEIGNRLPKHVWLSSIARDTGGITLEGHADSLGAVSTTMQSLAAAKHVGKPALLSAALETAQRPDVHFVKYDLRLETVK